MKFFSLALILVAGLFVAACESTTTANDTSGNGTPLGDSNVRVSGFVHGGATASPR